MTEQDLVRLSVFWVGSNQQIASSLLIHPERLGSNKQVASGPLLDPASVLKRGVELRRQVAALVNVQPEESIKILLGSPAGPQLTPVPFGKTLKYGHVDYLAEQKKVAAAWSTLTKTKAASVFVTQHSPAALAINDIVYASCSAGGLYPEQVYNHLPNQVRSNLDVTLVALSFARNRRINVPEKLSNNKQFALFAAKSLPKSNRSLLVNLGEELRADEDVVLAALARNENELFYASQKLSRDKSFALKAVAVNGLCIKHVDEEFCNNKEVALAAVMQNQAAAKYFSNALFWDKDIRQACKQATL